MSQSPEQLDEPLAVSVPTSRARRGESRPAVHQSRYPHCRAEITGRREISSQFGPPGSGRLAWVACRVVQSTLRSTKLGLEGTRKRIIRWYYVLLRHVHRTERDVGDAVAGVALSRCGSTQSPTPAILCLVLRPFNCSVVGRSYYLKATLRIAL